MCGVEQSSGEVSATIIKLEYSVQRGSIELGLDFLTFSPIASEDRQARKK